MNFEANVSKIEKLIGYTFKDKSLLTQAFTRTSFCNEHRSDGAPYQSNEVLEFFGDSVLSAAIITLFMRDFSTRYEHGIRSELREGDFSNIKSRLSDKKNLSDITRALGLQLYLRMGEGDRKLGIAEEPSVMEDLFESIIGAVYIDSGMDMKKVIAVVSKHVDVKKYLSSRSAPIQSHKNALQEWCADKRHRLPPPVYKTVSETGPEHKKLYGRACYIDGKLYAVGNGKNQKLADADAAEKTLKMLIESDRRRIDDSIDRAAVAKLKEYIKSKKLAPPTFHDMGVTRDSGTEQYAVACRAGGLEARGVSPDKSLARCAAAAKLLEALKRASSVAGKSEKKISRTQTKPKIRKYKNKA